MPTILLGISITTKYADIIWSCELRIAFSFKSFTDILYFDGGHLSRLFPINGETLLERRIKVCPFSMRYFIM